MPKSKRSKKPSVKVKDLSAKKNPKGGAPDIFAKLGDIKGESAFKLGTAALKTGGKFETTTLSSTDLLYNKLK
jgi:hypothetical protein